MTAPKPRRGGAPGRPLSHAEQIARGRVRLVVWLDAEDAARLVGLVGAYGSQAAAVRAALRYAASGGSPPSSASPKA